MAPRDVVTTRATRAGALAAELVGAESSLLRAERDLEALLDSLFGEDGWQDFEAGGAFVIDVYGCIPAPAAADALQRAGFLAVHLHPHTSREFRRCACRRVEAS